MIPKKMSCNEAGNGYEFIEPPKAMKRSFPQATKDDGFLMSPNRGVI